MHSHADAHSYAQIILYTISGVRYPCTNTADICTIQNGSTV